MLPLAGGTATPRFCTAKACTSMPDGSSTRAEHATMIDDCEKRESKLSDWERSFVASVLAQLEKGKSLSERQASTLDKIWERVT